MRRSVLALFTALAACATPAPSVERTPVASRPERLSTSLTREHRRALADTVRRSLRDELLSAWYPRAVDREYGGFLSQFEYDWRPSGAQDKMIVTQARHVWTTARAARLQPADTMLRAAAAHGAHFLRDRMWDREHGGFHWLVTRDGTPKAEDGRLLKRAYGQAFAIYGLAAYHEMSGDTAALRLAQDTFRWLDRHSHDDVHRGYFDYMDRDGTPLRGGLGRNTAKDQNSSIHLLEAFTELYRIWPDPVVRDRLRELLELIRDRIVVEPGTLTLFSFADWTPVSYRDSTEAVRRADRYYHDHVSFGHDVETAYLMLEAAEALGLGRDARTLRVAKQMLDHSLRTGWDGSVGGFYEAGYYHRGQPALTVVDDTKNWWAQAEGLNTLLIFGDLFPNDPMGYHQRFLTQWRYITGYLIDHEHGGWYAGGIDRQPEMRRALKGQIWKAAYHDGRALMNVARRLEQPGGAP
jgi:cellobiose epimerase